MINRYSLLFYFKKSRNDSKTMLPVYLRITLDSQRMEISTQRRWDPTRWNADAGRATGNHEDARSLNAQLETLAARVHEAHRQLIANCEEVTIDSLKAKLFGKRLKQKMFLEIYRKHNDDAKALIDNGFSKATVIRYETAFNHTANFIKWKYKTDDIDILDLSYEFVSEFEFWLKSVRKCNHNSTVKYITNMKKVVILCLKHGWLQRDPFIGYKMSKKEVIRNF